MRSAERRKVNIVAIKSLRSLVSQMDRIGNEEVCIRAGELVKRVDQCIEINWRRRMSMAEVSGG